MFVVIQIYNKFSGFLLFFTIIYNLSLEMSDEPFFCYKRLSFKLRITIYPNTVGPGVRIYHVGDFIHVGTQCSIGSHCTLLPGVVFGNKYEQENNNIIIVGDNCYFGLGAKIFGTINIGNNVTVGANSVITKNIPNNAVVGGIPARILKIKE